MLQEENKKKLDLGLVLGSGGLKPIASIALFDFVQEESIPVDLLVGCSGGGIYAAMYAMGYSTSDMIQITKSFLKGTAFSEIDYQTLLSIGKLPGGRFDLSRGITKDQAPLRMCKEVFKDIRIEDLEIPTILQTTDIQKGQSVVLDRGKLAEAVYASAAMYPILPPIFMEGKWLADGAFTAPLPITEALKRGSDLIITMIFNERVSKNPKHVLESFYNMNKIYAQSLIKSQLSLAIQMHHYEVIIIDVHFDKYISFADPRNIDEIIEIGRKAVYQKRSEILQAIEHFSNGTK